MLVCGGLSGVMEAASKGAAEAGGTVIGVLPTLSPADANPYVTHAVADRDGPRPEPRGGRLRARR